jgi:feruloyl esterase
MIKARSLRLILISLFAICAPGMAKAQACKTLAGLSTATASITSAEAVASGKFTAAGTNATISDLPAFCRVVANLKPTTDSDIHSEIWLPLTGWNGKFMEVGNGGWGGPVDYGEMAEALRRNYAVAATDDGNTTRGSAEFLMGHPEKFTDYAYRSQHETYVEAKVLMKAMYGREARYSYWNGCSAGGREGLLQAYRYPQEFDGIVAGDPANMRRNAWALWLANETFKDPAAHIPAAKYPMIHRAVLDECDAMDGLKDGLIENPERCHPNFKKLECKGADGADCLTARQVKTAETIVRPATDAAGHIYFPRLEPGTELAWARLAGGPDPAPLFWDQFRYLVYKDPSWNWRNFDLAPDAAKANAANKDIDELDPDLSAFAKHGGKLLIYHGWADQQVAPGSSVEFYESSVSASGDAADWIRLFMVPGMGHCGGGEGPDTFDKISVIEAWVEEGKAPARIIAAHETAAGKVDRTRPLCPYPQTARYNGSGSIDDAAHFACRAEK